MLKIDVDKCPTVAREYSVRSMPTFTLFGGTSGAKLSEMKGANASGLERMIDSHLDAVSLV